MTGASLFAATVDALSQRAPAVVAAAAAELRAVVLGLHFGDGSHATLRTRRSRLIVTGGHARSPDVEVHFDARAMNLVFDLAGRPVEGVLPRSLDVRGPRTAVLAVWRTFRLLGQRAAGLRAVQELWREHRALRPELWGSRPPPQPSTVDGVKPGADGFAAPRHTGWRALDFLDTQHTPSSRALLDGTVDSGPRVLWDGRVSKGWWQTGPVWDADLLESMARCRERVASEMERLIPQRGPKSALYDLMRSYPARQGKGLRPTLTIAACAAFAGRPEDAVRVAAALELFHNGFLVHDDIADESTHRRGRPTLHERHGIGLAVNAGDGLNLLAIDAVLSNLETLGLARSLGLIHEVLHMCRETVEGQAIELEWIREHRVPVSDRAYFGMSTKKTGWYTCISPCRLGAVCAGETSPARLDALNQAFRWIGIAFQIQDDVLNLVGEHALYGKEPLGDLLEGKRTVMLIHVMRTADEADRRWLAELLRLPRSGKTQRDAERVLDIMQQYGSIDYALDVADRLAHRGTRRFERDLAFLDENEGKGTAADRQLRDHQAAVTTPDDRELIASLGRGNEWLRALLCTLARRGTLLRQQEPGRADELLTALQPWPWFKGGQFLFDLMEWEDFMVEGPPPPLLPTALDAAAWRRVAERISGIQGVFDEGTGTVGDSARRIADEFDVAMSVAAQDLPQLEPGLHLYRDVVLGLVASAGPALRAQSGGP